MTRTFIVDDHPMVVEGIRTMLSHMPDIQVVGHAMNAASALGFFVNNSADVVLLDINLPDESGIEVCKKLLTRNSSLKILALTNFDQLTYLQSMREAGAKGYLLKNASSGEIQRALQTVLNGKEYWLGKTDVRESLQEHNSLLLTRREIEVLKLIAEGLTNQEIADKLYISASTVDSHRKNLISKLQVKNTAALVRTAFENKII